MTDLILLVSDVAHSKNTFEVDVNGMAHFGKDYNESILAKVLADCMTSSRFPHVFAGMQGAWIIVDGPGKVSFGPAIYQDAARSFFENYSYQFAPLLLEPQVTTITCECGAEKCRSSIHSSWCPKFRYVI